MALQIKKTGIEDFLDGSHNVKMLVLGGPGVGKTRMSSYWPKPIYADCEQGRASIADRGVAYAEIHSSRDMLDLLTHLKKMESTPKAQREYQTVVVDTVDGFQRSVKDEWLQKTNSGEFKGYDAWGYLDTKMTMLMTRLLNLDYNVIVLVHPKTTTIKQGEQEQVVNTLQLEGSIRTTIFNDFDLVGRLGTYWATEDGQKVEKRGLTFTPSSEWPFLKDRLAITPKWISVEFAETDYTQLFEALNARLETDPMTDGGLIEEIPDATDEQPPTVVGPTPGGPVGAAPAPAASDDGLAGKPKAELVEIAKKMGHDVKGNTLKAEIIALIESGPKAAPADDMPAVTDVEAVTDDGKGREDRGPLVDGDDFDEPAPAAPVEAPAVAASEPDKDFCSVCGQSLESTSPDIRKLSFIKYRKYLCADDYQAAKTANTNK